VDDVDDDVDGDAVAGGFRADQGELVLGAGPAAGPVRSFPSRAAALAVTARSAACDDRASAGDRPRSPRSASTASPKTATMTTWRADEH